MKGEILAIWTMKVSASLVSGLESLVWLNIYPCSNYVFRQKDVNIKHFALPRCFLFLFNRRIKMTVQDCAKVYKNLLRKEYVLYLENGICIELVFSQDNFKHLMGFHKLSDVSQVVNNSSKKIYKYALTNKNDINKKVKNSSHYSEISERILYFNLIPQIMESKIIVDFDVSKMPTEYHSKLLNTKYILYKRIEKPYKVAHLTLVEEEVYYKPETFFVEPSNAYLSEQTLLDITNVKVIDF